MTKDDAEVVASQYAGVCKNDVNDVKVFGKVCGSREVGNKLLHRSVARAREREADNNEKDITITSTSRPRDNEEDNRDGEIPRKEEVSGQ